MLVEVCFVDTQLDADLYKKLGAEAIAGAIYKAITGEKVKNMAGFKDVEGHYAEKHIN